MSDPELVLTTVDSASGVATVTLNRPEKRNALSSSLLGELESAYRRVLDVDDVVCVVLTGTDPAFCAGMDLREMGADAGNLHRLDFAQRIWESATPVIAAVNGVAATGGLELVLACDIVIASERARFVDTHVAVGVMPGAGMSVLLPAAVGVRKATEMSLTATPVDADEACGLGLVNRVVAHPDLLAEAQRVAREIAMHDPALVKRMNRLIKQNSRLPVGDALERERQAFRDFMSSEMDPAEVEARRSQVIAHGRQQSRRQE